MSCDMTVAAISLLSDKGFCVIREEFPESEYSRGTEFAFPEFVAKSVS